MRPPPRVAASRRRSSSCRPLAGRALAARRRGRGRDHSGCAVAAHRPSTSRAASDRLGAYSAPSSVRFAEQRAPLAELAGGAAVEDPAILQHDDRIGERQGRRAVRDEERGAVADRLVERFDEAQLRRGVNGGGSRRRGRDARVGKQRASDREALALAAGEREAALTDPRVVARRHADDRLVDLRPPGSLLDQLLGSIRPGVRDVLGDRGGEEERVVVDDGDLAPQRDRIELAQVDALERTVPAVGSYRRDTSEASALLPDPVGPTSATTSPPSMWRSTSLIALLVARSNCNETPSRSIRPHPAGSGVGSVGAVICGARSRISNSRAPEATARWAIPSEVPSVRMGPRSAST